MGERRRRRSLALLSVFVLSLLPACDTEPEIDPQQERNIQPGQRPEGTPRDEEN